MSVMVTVSEVEAALENGLVRLEIRREGERLVERVLAWHDGWHLILTSRPAAGDPTLDFTPTADRCSLIKDSPTESIIRLEGIRGPRRYAVEISLRTDEPYLHYKVDEWISGRVKTRSLMSRYAFAESQIDFSFVPHLRPRQDHVVGQFAFKSPAIIVQRDTKLTALIADVNLIEAASPQLVCLEPDMSGYDGRERTLAYGFKDHEPKGLIFFQHRPEMTVELENARRTYGYRLYASASAEPKYGYQEIVRLLWKLYGADNAALGIPQVLPLDKYGDYALNYAIPTLWRELPRDGLDCGGMVMGIKFPDDIWFHFFFNHLHTAYGLYRMGQRRGRPDLVEKAKKIRNLILTAPRKDGAIPAIFSSQIITGIRHDQWIPHAHWVGGFIPYQTQIARPADQPAFSTMDCAWTSYWMLRWSEDLERDDRLVDIAQECGELLLRSQLPSGAVPVWLDRETLEPLDLLRESPSAAASGLLFAKLYESTRDARFLLAAQRVAAFIENACMPQGWTDYECFFDSAGKPMDLTDPYSRQRPQCTFPIFWTAELAKLLYRTTQDCKYLAQARRAVDYLLLFQGVWSPPYLTVKGFGSIGIGNGHTGWNDARAGIFAPGIAEFFSLTGEIEYLQRGVAAMRAPLALMYIPENEPVSSVFDKGPLGYADECYAHRGRDARLGPSTFDFSVGYALMAFEELFPKYGSVFVDLGAKQGIGIDGYSIRSLATESGQIEMRIDDNVAHGRRIEISVSGRIAGQNDLCVNGKKADWISEDRAVVGPM